MEGKNKVAFSKRQADGSKAAKTGFLNEHHICEKFNRWQTDTDAQTWLDLMGYKVSELCNVTANQIPTRLSFSLSSNSVIHLGQEKVLSKEAFSEVLSYKKADVQISIVIRINNLIFYENISLKKVSSANYNQIDKRSVDNYKKLWGFSDEIAQWLKLMTGALSPQDFGLKTQHSHKVLLCEMPIIIQNKIVDFFTENKYLVLSDIFAGRGALSAQWMLVTDEQKTPFEYSFHSMANVINAMASSGVGLSKTGSTLCVGKVVLQRKGGTPDPEKLQFKFHPRNLFKI